MIIPILYISDDLPFFCYFLDPFTMHGARTPARTKGSSELSHQGGQRGLLLLGSEAKETTPNDVSLKMAENHGY